MSKRYPGGIIRKTPQTPSQTSAQGVWDMASVTQAVKENTWPIAGVPDPISKSLRFRSSASAYLSRTPASAGNRKTWTWSAWVKRGAISSASSQNLFSTYSGSSNGFAAIRLEPDNTFYVFDWTGAAFVWVLGSSQVFRDPSAWYHIVVAVDTTQATSTNRVKIYVNGSQITAFGTSTYPSLNLDTYTNSTQQAAIGSTRTSVSNNEYFDGYLAEVYFIDGQALTPSSFGGTNDQTGVWQPIAYTGTYGTNGFYLPFSNTASTTTLGYDFSGNSNNWTTNNISLTSGSTYDSMVDVPTQWIPYNTAGDTGALFRGNYCVFNPLDKGSTNFTFSNGNLTVSGASASSSARATMAVSSGKWYWEATPTAIGNGLGVGFAGDSSRFNPATWNAGTYVIYQSDGNKHINGSASSYGATYTTNDVIGVALDMDAGTITFYKNNVSQGTASTGLTGVYLPVFSQTSGATTGTINANFGAGSGFTYTPPSGFLTLNTFNLPTPTVGSSSTTRANKYFDAVIYTGDGASNRSVGGLNFQPDFMWNKSRSNAYGHKLYDAVRGVTKQLASQLANAESTTGTSNLVSFDSNGVTIGNDTGINGSGATFVNWYWNGGGSTVTNNNGSISSQVRANTTAGFSIVTYTGNNTPGATVGHGLGIAPQAIFTKQTNGADSWNCYHVSLGNDKAIFLNQSASTTTASSFWNNTTPSSTVITFGNAGTNQNNNVAYCWAPIAGYSAFGSYKGNGSSDGPFIYTGFRPEFVIIKGSDYSGADWVMYDAARNTYNALTSELNPNSSASENNFSGAARMDFLSNGIKIRTSGAGLNASGYTYIYMVFAEFPFKFALAR